MVAVLALLVIVIMTRLGDLLPDNGPVAAKAAPAARLESPLDLATVIRESRRYIEDAGENSTRDDAATRAPRVDPRDIAGLPDPFRFRLSNGEQTAGQDAIEEFVPIALMEQALSCSAILSRRGVFHALVADRVLSVGDSIASYQVIELSSAGVLLRRGDEERFLPLENKKRGSGPSGLAIQERTRGR
jgi:hypothetical protein